jgi:hypothetical protein
LAAWRGPSARSAKVPARRTSRSECQVAGGRAHKEVGRQLTAEREAGAEA